MRGALPTGFFLLAFASGCWGGARSAAKPPAAPTEATAAVPAWVPALTAEQRALMAPPQRPIKVPAARVFPDLARFGYAPSRPLGNPDDAVRFTRMVTQVLNDSPRFYTLESAPAEAANLVAQYGPPAGEPDGFAKLLYGKKHGELLGAHIIGDNATELIAEMGLALDQELTAEEIHATIHAHPTMSEVIHEATLAAEGHAIHF